MRAAPAMLVTGLVAAGCGGDERGTGSAEPTKTPTPTPTKTAKPAPVERARSVTTA